MSSRSRTLEPQPSGEHFAAYYTLRGKLTDSLTAEAGLRWDEETYGTDSDDQFGPRVHLAWRASDRTRLLVSWGRYQQYQGIEELPVEDGVDEFARAQSADHLILGLEQDLTPGYSLRVEAYRKHYNDLRTRYESLYDPLSLAPELRWDRVAIAPSSALAEGGELLLTRKPVDAWSGWFGYVWSRVKACNLGSKRNGPGFKQINQHALDTAATHADALIYRHCLQCIGSVGVMPAGKLADSLNQREGEPGLVARLLGLNGRPALLKRGKITG